jgi:hypothetical protein
MKYYSILIVMLLVFSGLTTFGISTESTIHETISMNFNVPQIQTTVINSNEYSFISWSQQISLIHRAGEPMLPREVKTIELPFGSRIHDISYTISTVYSKQISYPVIPAPHPVISTGTITDSIYECDPEIYVSDALFPIDWIGYHTGAGLNRDNDHTLFLTLEMFPVRYNPVQNTIHYVHHIDVEISYQLPIPSDQSTVDGYDLVVIAPEAFASELQRLIDHKNTYNMKTFLKTTESIYDEYVGFDKAEEIKFFIKDAFDTYGITYVMLVGGMDTYFFGPSRDDANLGASRWHLPVRYTNLKEGGSVYDPGYISDIYFADLYDAEGNFSSWDKDKFGTSDGIYAKWTQMVSGKDILDLYPDVYVGRLACRNKREVTIMVDKIIEYETTTTPDAVWFNRMIGIGGDSHDDSGLGTNYIEGEVLCDYVFDTYMTDVDAVRLYASHRHSQPDFIPSPEAIVREISKGAGYVLFDGHGHPGSWNTHWPGEYTWSDTPGGINCYEFPKFSNSGKYPITVIGGCHNSQFNISIFPTLLNKPYMWTHGTPYPLCFGWWIVRKVDGGAIASMGNTGLGYGAVGEGAEGPATLERFGGYQEIMFFKAIDEGVEFLGDAWGLANTYYLNKYPGMDYMIDCKTVQQWALLGDPSLKIGGYLV